MQRRRLQKKRRQRLQADTVLAIYAAPDAEFPMGFDFEQLDQQDAAASATAPATAPATAATAAKDIKAEDEQQQLFKWLLVELNETKAKSKAEKQALAEQHRQEIQRLTLGMDRRNETLNEEFQQLQLRFDEKNKRLAEQERLKEQERQTDQMKTPKKGLDPIWNEFFENRSWQIDPKTPAEGRAQEINTVPVTPTYAIGVTIAIIKALDIWIDDDEVNGGNVSERGVVDGHIVADWGVRVRNRIRERAQNRKTPKEQDVPNNSGDQNSQSPMSMIDQFVNSPESSPERNVGDFNNVRLHSSGDGDDGDDGDVDDNPDTRIPDRQRPRGYGDEDRSKEFRLVNPRNIIINIYIYIYIYIHW